MHFVEWLMSFAEMHVFCADSNVEEEDAVVEEEEKDAALSPGYGMSSEQVVGLLKVACMIGVATGTKNAAGYRKAKAAEDIDEKELTDLSMKLMHIVDAELGPAEFKLIERPAVPLVQTAESIGQCTARNWCSSWAKCMHFGLNYNAFCLLFVLFSCLLCGTERRAAQDFVEERFGCMEACCGIARQAQNSFLDARP